MPRKEKPPNSSASEEIQALLDFQWEAIKESANILGKGITFYLAITAALTGYVLTQDIDPESKQIGIYAGVLVSGFAIISFLSVGYGIIKGLSTLERSLKLLSADAFAKTGTDEFVQRGKRVILLVSICCLVIVFVIIFGIVFLF